MKRKTGYLANVPPLIFRFQYNPELLSEKKSFEYRETNELGAWRFDKAAAGTGVIGTIAGFLDDVKEFGSLLVNTKAMEAVAGKPRTISLDFAVDGRDTPGLPKPLTEGAPAGDPRAAGSKLALITDDPRTGGRIEPSLAVLRSFMNPSWDPISDVLSWFGGSPFCGPVRPPACNLKLGDLDLECVMTDLNIKTTHFNSDLTPLRAEVSVTLVEQTYSISTTIDTVTRLVEVFKSYGQLEGEDWLQTTPVVSTVHDIFA